ncbi:type III secretion system chaperone [Parachitinimonas caeni]|uniref:Type III secretion system chaperone n=1 Tax=Parachitinimonas caeni TaxID=3031301 RepID=A0ABT7DVL1_9NEIS|nr:type III secretion system chaperone [Parachitinimonas caeni]MDK2124078.1 type III secretion system chaperone [Parachitinimonas caeni]
MTVSDPGRLIADFGSLIGIPTLCLDERGSCSLVFDQKYRVTLALDSARGRFVLHCEVAALPVGLGKSALLALLQANYLWQGAQGATLSIDPPGQSLVLMYSVALAGAARDDINHAVESLLDAADIWSRYLESNASTRSAAEATPLRNFGIKA